MGNEIMEDKLPTLDELNATVSNTKPLPTLDELNGVEKKSPSANESQPVGEPLPNGTESTLPSQSPLPSTVSGKYLSQNPQQLLTGAAPLAQAEANKLFARQKLVDSMREKTVEHFNQSPEFYSNPENRDNFYRGLKKYYSPKEIDAIMGDDKPKNPLISLGGTLPPPSYRTNPITGKDQVEDYSLPVAKRYVESVANLVKSGAKKLEESGAMLEENGNDPKAILHGVVGMGQIAMGGAAAINPEVAAFTVGINETTNEFPQIGKAITPTEWNWYKENLTDKYTKAGKPIPAWLEDAGEIANFIPLAVLFHYGGKGIKEGKTRYAINEFNKGLKDLTPEQIDEIYNQAVAPKNEYFQAKGEENPTQKTYTDWVDDIKATQEKNKQEQQANDAKALSKALARKEVPDHVNDLENINNSIPVSELPVGVSINFQGEDGHITKSETGEIVFNNNKGGETIIGGGGDARPIHDAGIQVNEGTYSDKHGDYFVEKTADGHTVYKITDGKLKPVYENDQANAARKQAIINKALGKTNAEAKITELTDKATEIQNDIANAPNEETKVALQTSLGEIKNTMDQLTDQASVTHIIHSDEIAKVTDLNNKKGQLELGLNGLSENGKAAIHPQIQAIDETINQIKTSVPEEGGNNAVPIGEPTEIPVGEAPRNSAEVGEGIPKPKESAEPQQQISPEQDQAQKVANNEAFGIGLNDADLLEHLEVLADDAEKAILPNGKEAPIILKDAAKPITETVRPDLAQAVADEAQARNARANTKLREDANDANNARIKAENEQADLEQNSKAEDISSDAQKATAGITHEQTAKLREESGLEDYEKNPETQAGWEAEAEKQIKAGYNIEDLLDRTEKGTQPTPVEQKILKKYIASMADKIAKDPSDKNLNELKRLVDASDRIAGSAVAKSLVARQGTESIDDTLAGYFLRELTLNNDAPLTEGQKAKVTQEYEELTKAKEELEKKIADLEKENNDLKAKQEVERVVKESKRTQRKIAKEKLDEEFDSLAKDLSKIARGTLSSGINPELVAIVGKMVKNRVEKGIVKLEDIVDAVHSKVSEHLSKKDIQDIIAGVHNEKKQTRNEAAKTLYDLRQQAKLLNKLEDLQNGKEPLGAQKKIQRSQELESLRQKINDFKKEKADAEREAKKEENRDKRTPEQKALDALKKRTQTQISKVEDQLKKDDFSKPEKPTIQLDKEAIDLKDKYIKLKQQREVRIMQQEYANRSKYEKTRDKIVDIANVPRTIMSSMDFSAPLRQSLVATVSHPVLAGKAAAEMFKQAVSQKRFDRWFHDVKSDPRYARNNEAGLYIANPHDPRLTVKEEAFMNNLAEKIPVVGNGIKGSERAYVGYLNKMRWDLFNQLADAYESQGMTIENRPDVYKGLASYVNNATGRGKIGALESAAPILNSTFFAPRLIASRLNFLNPLYYAKLPKEVRVQALKDVGKFIGVGLTVLALAKLNGAEVEDDPRSSDFGKIKSGNTRWDIWGGYQQYIRVAAQLLTGESKSATTGKVNEITGEGVFGRTRGDVLLSFARGKLAPIPSTAADILSGHTVGGEKLTLAGELENKMLPLIYSDVKDAMKDKGMQAIFTVGVPATFGVGTQTYLPKEKKSEKRNIKEIIRPHQNAHIIPYRKPRI